MASTGETWRLGHRPALDGLRGIAVLLVVLSHAIPDWFIVAGPVGVSVFFALSGFLITSLLLAERSANGRVDLPAFYRRRAVRLLPALFVFAAMMLLWGYAIHPVFATPSDLLPVVFYVGNFAPMLDISLGAFGHTWSLAIEEQFYIAYPLILMLVTRQTSRRWLLWVTVGGVVLSFGIRAGLWATGASSDRIYFATETNIGCLLVGCAVAILMHGRPVGRSQPLVAWAGLAALGLMAVVPDGREARTFVPMLAALVSVLVIAALVAGPYAGRLQAARLVVVGQRSYGLYLWHFPLLWILLPMLDMPRLISAPLLIATAWGLTCLSWRFVEQPAKRWAAGQPSRVQEATTA